MALTANKYAIPSGAPSGGKQPMVSAQYGDADIEALEQNSAINLSIQYTYSNNTTIPAGNTQIKGNNADLTLANELKISYIARGGYDIENLLKYKVQGGPSTGRLYLQRRNNSDVFGVFDVTSITYDDANNQLLIGVKFVQGNPTFVNGNPILGELISAISPATVSTFSELQEMGSPVLDKIMYVKDLDISFEYDGSKWVQCGENTILRDGLIKESLYANNVRIG